jgi:hypothetical protein
MQQKPNIDRHCFSAALEPSCVEPPLPTMMSATRALAASSLLLCAMACAAIALLTIASSATEELAQQPHAIARSSTSGLEAQLEADAKTAAAKDAGAQLLQSQLIKYASKLSFKAVQVS